MEMVESILSSITGHQHVRSEVARGEKRKSLRIPMSQRIKLTVMQPKPTAIMAVIREISAHGVGLLVESVFEAGTEFVIEFPRPGCISWWAHYRTLRCTAAPSQKRLHYVGALFVGMQKSAPRIAAPAMMQSLASADQANELNRIRQAVLDM